MRLHHCVALGVVGFLALGAALVASAQAQGERFGVQAPTFIPPGPGFAGGRGRNGGGRGAPVVSLDPARLAALKAVYVAPKRTPFPADNPPTPNKVALGEKLFFDPRLSVNGKLACASCHDVRHAFTDGRTFSLGVKDEPLARHTPTVINLAWSQAYFWDGRAASLEQQAVMPIAEAKEMGMPHGVMLSRLSAIADYRRLFQQAFPGQTVSVSLVGKALAAFERTLTYADAPFDRWIAGDEDAISEQAKRGFIEFNTRAGCAQCHSGWNFTDGKFHDIGLPDDDVGRFGVEADERLRHAFKTPGLRNIAERAPYMHTGQLENLGEVLRFYNRSFARRATLSPEMANVRVRGSRDIIAFLETLSSPAPVKLVQLQEALDLQTHRSDGSPTANRVALATPPR